MNRTAENRHFESEKLTDLSEDYIRSADALESRRLSLMERRRKMMLPPDELRSLEARIATLYAEVKELRRTAQHLRRLAAPKTESPSLSRRGRGIS
jgi:predicted RNase H-like nuclease (RuvC/YqgF family)